MGCKPSCMWENTWIILRNASAPWSQATMLKIVAPQVVTECGMPKRRHVNRPTSRERVVVPPRIGEPTPTLLTKIHSGPKPYRTLLEEKVKAEMSRTDKNGLKVADGRNYWAGRKLLVHQRRGIASSGVQRKLISLLIEDYVARERFHRTYTRLRRCMCDSCHSLMVGVV